MVMNADTCFTIFFLLVYSCIILILKLNIKQKQKITLSMYEKKITATSEKQSFFYGIKASIYALEMHISGIKI